MSEELNNSMKGKATIVTQNTSDVFAHVRVAMPNDIPAKVRIYGNKNRLKGKVEIVAPPTHNIDVFPVQDTYVKSDRDAFSFGTNQTLHIGKTNDNNAISYLKFDLKSGLKSSYVIKKAVLRLYNVNLDNPETNINLYKLNNEWSETGTTYLNKPLSGDLLKTGIIKLNSRYTDIDMTEYAQSIFKESDNGLSLESTDNDISLYSKESSDSSKPRLIITYYDLNEMVDVTDVYAHVRVNARVSNDVSAHINIKPLHEIGSSEVLGKVKISKTDQLAHIKVLGKLDIPARVKVKAIPISVDTNAHVYVEKRINDGQSEIPAHIQVTKIYQAAHVKVSKTKTISNDIDGKIRVRTIKLSRNDVNAKVSINRPDISEVNGKVKIIRTKPGSSEVLGKVKISKTDQLAHINIVNKKTINNDIDSKIKVIKGAISEVNSKVEVTKSKTTSNDIEGTIKVNRNMYDDQYAKVTVTGKKTTNNDVEATIKVNKTTNSDQPAKVKVVNAKSQTNDVEATIKVNKTTYNDIDASVLVNVKDGNDVYAHVKVTNTRFNGSTQIIYR